MSESIVNIDQMGHTLSFSAHDRSSIIKEMDRAELDLFVIGGGITGAGIALDAALRGLKVGLVEKQDFGAGTSSRSTKLIHGGLRYLKQLEISLVREVGRERAILYRNAPHLVIPEPMLLPIVKGGTYGKWATSIGLWMYDLLAGVKQGERRKMLSRKETLQLEPLLRAEGLQGGGLYVEYRTDDARLTLDVMRTAFRNGALAVNYTEVTKLLYDENRKLYGVNVRDTFTEHETIIKAKKIVNATGPWVDGIREMDGSLEGKRLHLSKGVHIVVDQSRFPLKQATYFDVSDGRMVFAIPRDGKTYIGTTDTNYKGDLINPPMTGQDLDYLVQAANEMFPSVHLTEQDVESFWVGLRPLIHEEGKPPSELSRKDELFYSPTGMITIAGGKLTGFRKMAERVVDVVAKQLRNETGRMFKQCQTKKEGLVGGDVENWEEFFSNRTNLLLGLGFNEMEASKVIHRYGAELEGVLDRYNRVKETSNHEQQDGFDSFKAWKAAEIQYAVEQEMAVYPEDFLIRRTGEQLFNAAQALDIEGWVRQVMRELTR